MYAILLFICKSIAVTVFAFFVSFFTMFFDMIIQPGMVAHFYLNGLARHFGKSNKDFDAIEKMEDKAFRFEQHFNYAIEHKPVFKMLGGCILCVNVWHSILISVPILFLVSDIFEWYWILPEIFISSFYLRYLTTKI